MKGHAFTPCRDNGLVPQFSISLANAISNSELGTYDQWFFDARALPEESDFSFPSCLVTAVDDGEERLQRLHRLHITP